MEVKFVAIRTLKIGFEKIVSCYKKRGWLAPLSTDTDITGEEMIRLYGKRGDIEVFNKMCKQHLKLAKEIQIRDYDGLIAHTSIVIARYNILTLLQIHHKDQRSFGDLFRAMNEEMDNLSFIEAFKRILQISIAFFVKSKDVSENMIQTIFDTIMGYALKFIGLKNSQEPLLAW